MQATLLSSKELTTKYGQKILSEVRLESGEQVQLWTDPKDEGCISSLPANSVIEVTKDSKGKYKWVAGALTGKEKKLAILQYSQTQIKFLSYLHNEIEKTFDSQKLSEQALSSYAVAVFQQTAKHFDL